MRGLLACQRMQNIDHGRHYVCCNSGKMIREKYSRQHLPLNTCTFQHFDLGGQIRGVPRPDVFAVLIVRRAFDNGDIAESIRTKNVFFVQNVAAFRIPVLFLGLLVCYADIARVVYKLISPEKVRDVACLLVVRPERVDAGKLCKFRTVYCQKVAFNADGPNGEIHVQPTGSFAYITRIGAIL